MDPLDDLGAYLAPIFKCDHCLRLLKTITIESGLLIDGDSCLYFSIPERRVAVMTLDRFSKSLARPKHVARRIGGNLAGLLSEPDAPLELTGDPKCEELLRMLFIVARNHYSTKNHITARKRDTRVEFDREKLPLTFRV